MVSPPTVRHLTAKLTTNPTLHSSTATFAKFDVSRHTCTQHEYHIMLNDSMYTVGMMKHACICTFDLHAMQAASSGPPSSALGRIRRLHNLMPLFRLRAGAHRDLQFLFSCMTLCLPRPSDHLCRGILIWHTWATLACVECKTHSHSHSHTAYAYAFCNKPLNERERDREGLISKR